MSAYSWTGDATSITIWGSRVGCVGTLNPLDEFELHGLRFQVKRQARRTTFAICTQGWAVDIVMQIKHSKVVKLPMTVERA